MSTLTRSLRARGRALRNPRRRERGSASLMVAVLAVALLMMAGLVSDGATKLRAARHATATAGEAARAATQQINPATIGGSPTLVNTATAAGAARTYLRQAGATGTVTITGNTITVTTTEHWQPAFLGAVGVGPQTMTGHATARIQRVLNGRPTP